MSSPYAQGLDLLLRVQERIRNIESGATDHCITTQRWYALRQDWKHLTLALIATGEAADKAVAASSQQEAQYRACANRSICSGEFRTRQADTCLRHFRYVTALSHHARVVRQHHESELLSWRNLQAHYQEALCAQAHMVHAHQTFLDNLSHNIEAVKRSQGLEMIYVRWIQLRATADLTKQAKRFHLMRKRFDVRKTRADRACRGANQLREKMAQCVREYEHLETEVLSMQRAIQALWDVLSRSDARDTAVSTSVRDGNTDQMAVGV